ncbi:MAG: MATE family efflux transporter [Lachnospiraceae bacterium]|nr:MATE family efflux transporter [Lachnospiraceae bacterium]
MKTFVNEDKKQLFESAPVLKAVLALEIPTVISQLITVVYNMADTYFIGQVGDPDQVAATSICLPVFMLLTGMANLFGIGGASLISRSLGKGDTEQAKKASAFSIWAGGFIALLYGVLVYLFRFRLFPLVGADKATIDLCNRYSLWVITCGAIPTVLSGTFAHLVRAEGYSKQASFGVAMGGILNILLDPLFISGLHMEITGAAVATLLSNIAATLYFIILIYRKRAHMVLSMHPRYFTLRSGLPSEIMLVGLPSAVMNLSGVLSNIFMNRLMSSYSNAAVAGIGIAKKVDLLTYAVATGMSQGVIPLIGYNYSSKNYKRMMSAVKTTVVISIAIAVVSTAFLLTQAPMIVRAFINDQKTVVYGSLFQRIICVTGPFIPVSMVIITMFQSTGRKMTPLILSVLRKGGVDVPAMFLMNHLVGITGIAWATPIADIVSMTVAIICFIPFWRDLHQRILDAEAAGE